MRQWGENHDHKQVTVEKTNIEKTTNFIYSDAEDKTPRNIHKSVEVEKVLNAKVSYVKKNFSLVSDKKIILSTQGHEFTIGSISETAVVKHNFYYGNKVKKKSAINQKVLELSSDFIKILEDKNNRAIFK